LNSAHCTSRNDGAPISQGYKELFNINIALSIKKRSTFLTALFEAFYSAFFIKEE